MPRGAVCLATSPDCAVQAMAWGPRAYSTQFHLEAEPDTVQSWMSIPTYRTSLIKALGETGPKKLELDFDAHITEFNRSAKIFYINWCQKVKRT